ncbi:TetR/AcrR family transcriptional regulator [Pediococcus claussenii]|uniref:Transcriptional regulator, TetR family n=1 Tax=Pediococcus claussenii (strain ATCC BAA-344 / DSM 14800 / JCM 18046 / KCTC 3811 / LMG 21948 / P06) TaxID=701521 RepID=G8PAF9_PEDCP|nr:TetR/AcrR family transcriptional regulator [Pediococcus claussenii]AEV95748.1 Transcriptional regulator, TetR family [Pediococcus claussenii ATCC BAA-344]ANZ69257.1 hypothetical protein AYR57_02595 [Pediococcus claussenii]ANZ71076.1 hypothetical protein AYR58_02610 [Pediococcus claussenii]KRN20358.1 hypothetical protein IV79_GL000411 [Pediococcus claussenii]
MKNNTKSQIAIYGALVKLIKIKPLNQIEVTELVRLAEISRATFYLYFKGKDDLVQKFENYLLSKFEIEGNQKLKEAIKLTSQSASARIIYPIFLEMMRIIRDDFESYQVLLSMNGDANFANKMESEFVQILFETLDEDSENMEFYKEIPTDYVMRIFFSDILTIIQYWVSKKNPESPEKVAEIITTSRYTLANDLIKNIHHIE